MRHPLILERLFIAGAMAMGCALGACRSIATAAPVATPTATASAAAPSTATVAGAAPEMMSGWLDAARLPDSRWPVFRNYQADVRRFYALSGNTLAWVHGSKPTPAALALITALQDADARGLRSEDYDGGRWSARVARLQQPAAPSADADRANFDLALTVSLMRFITDLHSGRVSPAVLDFGFDVAHKKYDLPALLHDKFVNANPPELPALIAAVEPPYEGYRRAQRALQIYAGLALKEPQAELPVPSKPIRPGELYADLPQLVELLKLVGDLASDAAVPLDPPVYQQPVVDAVKSFQLRHGLESDGKLGPSTLKAMNVPLSWRAEQLRLSLEHWRWVPPAFERPPLMVNIPQFQLRGFGRDYVPEIRMRVVVGKTFHHRTPVFAARLTEVVFRPYWNVPLSIQRNELVPKIRRDRGYLVKGHYEVVDGHGGVVTDGAVSDAILARLRAGQLLLRQRPGEGNSLGLVKFMFPNEHNVYMHDTPSVALFARSRRDFSHGCIRVQDPVTLAVWVLRGLPGWDQARVIAAMHGAVDNLKVRLAQPIPVLIIYRTAIAPPDGKVYFFDDIYGYDAELEKALANRNGDQ